MGLISLVTGQDEALIICNFWFKRNCYIFYLIWLTLAAVSCAIKLTSFSFQPLPFFQEHPRTLIHYQILIQCQNLLPHLHCSPPLSGLPHPLLDFPHSLLDFPHSLLHFPLPYCRVGVY